MSTTGTVKHRLTATGTNRTDVQVSKDPWNDSLIAAGGAAGALYVRDTVKADGWGWIDAVAVGRVLVSGGVGVEPAWSDSPSLTNLTLASAGTLAWSTDTILVRDAANTLALRNGTNAQRLHIYGAYTDATNYERIEIGYVDASQGFIVNSALSGTGTARPMTFGTNNNYRWRIDTSGHLLALGAYNIGDGLGNSPVNIYAEGLIKSSSATAGIGYATGAGGAVTQITSRTTGVTLNFINGEITLVSAAGSTTAASFTVTNSAMAATDHVDLNQKTGANKYVLLVTAKAAGSFEVTVYTTGGTATEAPVISFAILKGSAS